MSLGRAFVKAVGTAPFPGKHQIRAYYGQGLLGLRRKDGDLLWSGMANLDRMTKANAGLGGYALVGAGLAILNDVPLELTIAEAGACSVVAAGHLVSAAAQRWLYRDLDNRAAKVDPDSMTCTNNPVEPPYVAEATPIEKTVLYSGLATVYAVLGHSAIQNIIGFFGTLSEFSGR